MQKKIKKTSKKNEIKKIDFVRDYLLSNKKVFFIGISFLIIVFLIFKINKENKKVEIKNNLLPKAVKRILQNDKANISIDYLKETNGVYEFQLTLKDQNNQKFISYITKDGKILFVSGIKLDELFKNQSNQNQPQKAITCADLKKSTQPKLTAYIMANCPYGLQMQRVFKNVIKTNKEAEKNLRIEYIFNQDSNFDNGKLTSLHGKEEADENLRQICIREEQPNFYWSYVECYMKKANSTENCLRETGIDKNLLDQCMSDKNRGLKYAKKDFENTQRLGISGSPTLVLNDEQIVSESEFGGRNPNSIKEILCCSGEKKLAYCNQEFSKNNSAISFSETDEQTSGNSGSGGCN